MKAKKYRIKRTESSNEKRYYPQVYEGFFSGWCCYFNKTRTGNQYFTSIGLSLEFINEIQNKEVKEIKIINV